jgi:cobyrinic acid a,c-diamide synthase
VRRGHGIDGTHDGVVVHNVLASYAHLRHTGGNDWPRRFVAFVRAQRRQRVGVAAAAAPEAPRPRRAPRRRIAG